MKESTSPRVVPAVTIYRDGKIDLPTGPDALIEQPEESVGRLLPLDMIHALSRLVRREPGSGGAWRSYLDELLKRHDGKLRFTTFMGETGFALSSVSETFEKTGDGGLRATADTAELFTIGDQTTSLTLSGISPARSYVFHLLALFPSNVRDNFYVSFENDSQTELVRFGNAYIALCDDASTLECDTKGIRLYSFVVGGGFVSLFVNGLPQKRKARKTSQNFRRAGMRLVGDQGADLSAVVRGVEIWELQRQFEGFNTRSREFLLHRLDELIDSGDAEGVHDWIVSYDDIDFAPFHDRILRLLEAELGQSGVREWIYEDVLQRMGPEIRVVWRRILEPKMPEAVISVENLSVRFHRLPNKQLSMGRILGLRKSETFNVLENTNFRVYPGDILGVIGANGAGKSTLLKALAGLVPIVSGRISLKGHHLLLSPGLGIRNELSGRDNIYLAGCFMGLTLKQVDGMYEEIVEFSELQESIDQPFKFYSDGMKSRLVFSIATSVAPDILMLDELLNAGDIKFQLKAARRLDELIGRAKIVIVVTHSVPFVAEKCNKALLLSHGRQVYYGDPKSAIAHYLNELHMPSTAVEALPETSLPDQQRMQQESYRMGSPM